jgi:hypothetical protein
VRNSKGAGKRRALTGVAAAVATGAAFGASALTGTASAGTTTKEEGAGSSGPRPTVVLEHSAFADSSSRNGVISRLRANGYPVVAAPHSVAVSHPGLVTRVSEDAARTTR